MLYLTINCQISIGIIKLSRAKLFLYISIRVIHSLLNTGTCNVIYPVTYLVLKDKLIPVVNSFKGSKRDIKAHSHYCNCKILCKLGYKALRNSLIIHIFKFDMEKT